MNTDRLKVLQYEIILAYNQCHKTNFIPTKEVFRMQLNSINAGLSKNIKTEILSELFDIAKNEETIPTLTGIRKAHKIYMERKLEKHRKVWGEPFRKLTEKEIKQLPAG